jgi:hypothetical protein
VATVSRSMRIVSSSNKVASLAILSKNSQVYAEE